MTTNIWQGQLVRLRGVEPEDWEMFFEWDVTVGAIDTHTCDPRNGTFQYGVTIRREHARKGYASEAIRLVLRYFFHELRYQKVNVEIYGFNEASVKLHRELGFREEGRLRRMVYTGGAYHDSIMLGMTREEFEEAERELEALGEKEQRRDGAEH